MKEIKEALRMCSESILIFNQKINKLINYAAAETCVVV